MKLFHHPLTKRASAALVVAALAGGGVATAQFTGIGTTTPDATLHVKPITAGTDEPIRIESVKDLTAAELSAGAYDEVLVYDEATGLFRREAIADLLDQNGEWVLNAGTDGIEGTADDFIEPRRFTGSVTVNSAGVAIAVPTNVNNTFTVGSFATNLGGTLGVAGAATLQSTLGVDGDVTFNSTPNVASAADATRILIQNAAPDNVVRHITVEDLLSSASYWVNAGTDAAPNYQPRGIQSSLSITGGNIGIGSATTLTLGSTTQDTAPTGSTQVLIQDAGGVVGYVTIEDLIEDNGIWEYDDDTAPTLTRPRLFPTAINVNGALVDINVATDISGALTVSGAAATELTGTLDVTGVTAIGTGTLADDDLILMQDISDANADRVRAVSVTELISNASYWDWDGTTLTPADVSTANDIQITDGDINVNATLDVIGNTTVTGTFAVTGNSTFDGTTTTTGDALFQDGLTVNGGGVDHITFAELTQVFDVQTDLANNSPALVAGEEFKRVLITDHDGVVRYIDASDLVSSASEWVYEDNGSAGLSSDDRVYVRRLDGGAADDDVYVDGVGNFVLSATKAYQFGDATNQVNATELSATGAYTFDLESSLDVETGDAADVSFTEGANAVPWLHYAATEPGGTVNTWAAGELGRVGINTATPEATLHVAGNIVSSNSTVTSDRRFKRDVAEFAGALEAVKALRGVTYQFRHDEFPSENFDDAEHIGFIAQEIREILPQAVYERGDGFLTVDYGAVTPVLVEAIQELTAQVEQLKSENTALRGGGTDERVGAVSTKQLRDLEQRLAAMDARLEAVANGK